MRASTKQFTRQLRHLLVAASCLVFPVGSVLGQESAPVSHRLMLDNFDDGNTDGWQHVNAVQNAGLGGTDYDASSGALNISSKGLVPAGTWDFTILEDSNGSDVYANGIFRTVVQTTDQETDAFFAIRTSLPEEADWPIGGYLLSVAPGSAGGSMGIIEMPGINESLRPKIVKYQPDLGFAPDVPYNVEVIADGPELSFMVWPEGEDKPDQPQLKINNAKTGSGGIALGFSNSPPDNRMFSGFYDDLTFEQVMPGDFDNNKLIDTSDIDLLANELRQSRHRRIFDMNNDGAVTDNDHTFLVSTLGGITPGDADLNGKVEFADFLKLAENFGMEGGWAEGNFNTDALVGFEDFLVLSENFGGGTPAAATVPEPHSIWLAVLSGLSLGMVRRNWAGNPSQRQAIGCCEATVGKLQSCSCPIQTRPAY